MSSAQDLYRVDWNFNKYFMLCVYILAEMLNV